MDGTGLTVLPDFDNVVHRGRKRRHGGENKHTLSHGDDNPMPMVIHGDSKDTVPDGTDDETRENGGIETVLDVPGSVVAFLEEEG